MFFLPPTPSLAVPTNRTNTSPTISFILIFQSKPNIRISKSTMLSPNGTTQTYHGFGGANYRWELKKFDKDLGDNKSTLEVF